MPSTSQEQYSAQYKAKEIIYESSCPACDYHIAVPFYDGGYQPLAEKAWSRNSMEAKNMLRLPLSFKRCVSCGHVYNSEYEDDHMPSFSSDAEENTFNLNELLTDVNEEIPEQATIIELACGQGGQLHLLAQENSQHQYIGFDPMLDESGSTDRVELRAENFEPLQHLAEIKPHVVICREKLNHLKNPSAFLQTLDFAARHENRRIILLLEVSCIDGIFSTGTISDFYYEMHSHFSTSSLSKMLERSTQKVLKIIQSQDGESLFAIAIIGEEDTRQKVITESLNFWKNAKKSKETVNEDLARLQAAGYKIAIWGGAGKAAAFINFYELDQDNYPWVIESDIKKIGGFVPGTGQEIRSLDFLNTQAIDVILIPTQWKGRDIVKLLEKNNITSKVYIEYQGRLVDFKEGEHPFK
jgi:2-polyprenyl-3-methyl-5-hydroxy-6-metoxy-1,4-benzoquinol methylase